MNQRPKALISVRAKKFIPSQQFVTLKAHNNLQGVAKGNKANHGWENTL